MKGSLFFIFQLHPAQPVVKQTSPQVGVLMLKAAFYRNADALLEQEFRNISKLPRVFCEESIH